MKIRFISVAAITVLLLNAVGFAAGDTQRAQTKKREVTRLVSLLPASDCIAVFDSKRFFVESLPKLLSANQPMLADVMGKISEMEKTTGIDLKKFGQVAVGISYTKVSDVETDFEPVAIANGEINAGAMIAVAKLASNNKYRQEKIGERTVYVFTPQDILSKRKPVASNSHIASVIDKAFNGLVKEVAVVALDENTLVLGPLSRVRETIERRVPFRNNLIGMLSVRETTVMSFAGKMNGGFTMMLPLAPDELGKNIEMIDFLSGSIDVAGVGTTFQAMARTKEPEQAKMLGETLGGLQIVGEAILGASKRPDQKIYGRLIKNAKIETRGTDLSVELLVSQAEIDGLLTFLK